ncbi:MAG: dockerin type I repeat-containing protein [Oscillospiraceae bacterium]|nr:dockerin type I repeat-containing protein [Oscillospiraceae bacterium]
MAKHAKPFAGKERVRIILLILTALCAVAAIFVGAMILTGDREKLYQGQILPPEQVLSEKQVLLPQANGGYLLLSTDGQMTDCLFLTGDGAAGDSESDFRQLLGSLERVVVVGETAYVVTASVDEAETETALLAAIPLDGRRFSEEISQTLFNNTTMQLDLQSVNVDLLGNVYALNREFSMAMMFPMADPDDRVILSMPEDVPFDGMAFCGDVVYLSGKGGSEGPSLWRCSLSPGSFNDPTALQGGPIQFPLTFLSDQLALDKTGAVYFLSDAAMMMLSNGPVFASGCAVLDGDQNVVGITGERVLSQFSQQDLGKPLGSYRADGKLCAIAGGDPILALVYDGDVYRTFRLNSDDFVTGEEEASSEETTESVDGSSPSSLESVSEIPSSSQSESTSSQVSSEIEVPIESGQESSAEESSSSAISSASSSESSSSEAEEPLAFIVSSRFDIDRGSNVVVLPQGITVAQFRKTVPLKGATLTAVRPDGGSYSSGALGTGMRLQLYNDWELMDEITVLVEGDLNGNGAINSADVRLLFQHLTEDAPLTSYWYTAADMDNDGVVDTKDLVLLKRLAH